MDPGVGRISFHDSAPTEVRRAGREGACADDSPCQRVPMRAPVPSVWVPRERDEGDRVEVPGEREAVARVRNAGQPISLPRATWDSICDLARDLGVAMD